MSEPGVCVQLTFITLVLHWSSAATLSGRQGAVAHKYPPVSFLFLPGYLLCSLIQDKVCHQILPESKRTSACLLLLQDCVEATSEAEYDRPQRSLTEQDVALEEQDATWLCPPVTSTVWNSASLVSAQEKLALFVPQSTRAVRLAG